MTDEKPPLAMLEDISKRAQEWQRNAKRTVNWAKRIHKAVEQKDWLCAQRLLGEKDVEIVRQSGCIGGPFELDSVFEAVRLYAADATIQFSRQIEKMCEDAGLKPVVRGSHEGLTIRGMIQVEPDFSKDTVTIRTLARKMPIKGCLPKDVFEKISDLAKTIWDRKFDASEFIEKLYRAYSEKHKDGDEAELSKVQETFWHSEQPDGFWKSYNPKQMKEYTTDEFSADLTKLLASCVSTTRAGKKLQLATHGGGLRVYDEQGDYYTFKSIRFGEAL